MSPFRRFLRLVIIILFVMLASVGVALTGVNPVEMRDRYQNNIIRIERVEKDAEETDDEQDDFS